MHVAVVTSLWPSPGSPGEGIFAERRWRHFADLGHAVRVVRPVPAVPPWIVSGERARFRDMPEREERAGFVVSRPRYLHVPRAWQVSSRAFARAAHRGVLAGERDAPRADVIVADYAWPAAACDEWARAEERAFVVSGRGSDVLEAGARPGIGRRLAQALASADARIAVSADLARAMDRLAGRAGTRLVPNGVDHTTFHPRDRSAARAELGLGAGPLVLVVGHLIERKAPLFALEVFRRAVPPPGRIAFIGSGPLGDELTRRSDAAGLAERVLRRDSATAAELSTWYAAADALLLTSTREGRPNVVLEALACGRPVLATAAGGTAELLGELPRCLVTSFDVDVVARALAALLADPPTPEHCTAAVAHLTWEATARALEAALDAARASRGGTAT